jgi:hypothetical protein
MNFLRWLGNGIGGFLRWIAFLIVAGVLKLFGKDIDIG